MKDFSDSYIRFKIALEEHRLFLEERKKGKEEVSVKYLYYCRKTKVTKERVVKSVDWYDLGFILIRELPHTAEGMSRWYSLQFEYRYCYPFRFSEVGESTFERLSKDKHAYLYIEDDFWW